MNVKITQNMCRYLRNRVIDPERRKLEFVTFFAERQKKFAGKLNIFISNILKFFVFKQPRSITELSVSNIF